MAIGDVVAPATGSSFGSVIFGDGIPKTNAPGVLSLRGVCGVLHVAVDGDDAGGDGSLTNPFLTLARAFAVIAANPKPGGYEVNLPGCTWEENVGLPPPNTRIKGHGPRSILRNVGNTPLVWAEGVGNAGQLAFEDLAIFANITGRNSGDISLDFRNADASGTLTRIGRARFDGMTSYPSLVNISNLEVRNTQTRNASLAFSYLPSTGSNGLGAVGHLIDGGQWNTLTYRSELSNVEAVLLGIQANQVRAELSGTIRVRASRVLSNLVSNDPASLIEYDSMVMRDTPSYLGVGSFRLSEILCSETYAAGFTDSTVTVCVPRHEAGTVFDRIFPSFTKAGFTFEYVSNTPSDVNIRIIPPVDPYPVGFTVHYIIRPRLGCSTITT